MQRWNRNLIYGVVLSLSLSSCGLLEWIESRNRSTNDSVATSPTPAAPAPAQPTSAPESAESLSPFTALTAPQRLQPIVDSPVRESYACLTANYFADLVWQDNQLAMSFGRKSAEPVFQDRTLTVKGNTDGSFTYEVAQGALYYTRVYPDRTCLIQVVDPASSTATIEENGSLGELVIPR